MRTLSDGQVSCIGCHRQVIHNSTFSSIQWKFLCKRLSAMQPSSRLFIIAAPLPVLNSRLRHLSCILGALRLCTQDASTLSVMHHTIHQEILMRSSPHDEHGLPLGR